MATNASTWFFKEPEHNAYLIEERVNHTFWSNRVTDVSFDCIRAEPPFQVVGQWRSMPVELEWEPRSYLTLKTQPGDNSHQMIVGIKEILGFNPAISYVDPDGQLIAEWHANEAGGRIQEIQGNPNYRSITRYK